MRPAIVLLLSGLLLAGCSSAPPAAGPGADEPRSSDDAAPAVVAWTLSSCEHRLFEVEVPAALVRAHVPARFEPYEFPPGVAFASIHTLACANATLPDGGALVDLRSAGLAVAIRGGSGFQMLQLDWVADPALGAALAQHGFKADVGDVQASPGTLPTSRQTTVLGDAEKARVTWTGEMPASTSFPNEARHWIQDREGRDVTATLHMPQAYSADGLRNHCVLETADTSWRDVLGPGPGCTPFVIDGELRIEFPVPGPGATGGPGP